MTGYRLTRRARRDLVEIWSYIAEDSEDVADRFIDLLMSHSEVLGKNPYIGRVRDDLRKGCRSFPLGQYVIIYRVAKPGVHILHVRHGKRAAPSSF